MLDCSHLPLVMLIIPQTEFGQQLLEVGEGPMLPFYQLGIRQNLPAVELGMFL